MGKKQSVFFQGMDVMQNLFWTTLYWIVWNIYLVEAERDPGSWANSVQMVQCQGVSSQISQVKVTPHTLYKINLPIRVDRRKRGGRGHVRICIGRQCRHLGNHLGNTWKGHISAHQKPTHSLAYWKLCPSMRRTCYRTPLVQRTVFGSTVKCHLCKICGTIIIG